MSGAKGSVIRRLKIVKGHMNGVIFMIDRGDYCIGISQQIHAVEGALRKIDRILVKDYLKNGGSLLNLLKVIKNKN